MNPLSLVEQILALHSESILQWTEHGLQLKQQGLLRLIEENHSFNFLLWNAEDRARREDKGHQFVYEAKREIDGFNQQRNNRMESIDGCLAEMIPMASYQQTPVHSETPGMIIDRLSILSLKSYHMEQQALRTDVDEPHRQSCAHKLAVLREQRQQLSLCLQRLLQECIEGQRCFRLYHQFKMYNDPTLNPQLYKDSV